MHIHILGICGTFMAGLAELATQMGHRVTGSDSGVYPPMSTFLHERGIEIYTGYDSAQLTPSPDLVLIGNALSRGNEAIEFVLNRRIRYMSGPQWLAEYVLYDRHVIAVAGTHGKTTTTSLIAFLLESCGINPGFLIGGIAQDFDVPAKLGDGQYFVVEADEYDTAFFDKRSKFVHYRPNTLVINNLEFDHADIFPDLEAIKIQFHHLIRTVPANGTIILPSADKNIADVIARGCWSATTTFGFDDQAAWRISDYDGSKPDKFQLDRERSGAQPIRSPLIGQHNALNTTAALCAVAAVGVPLGKAEAALSSFKGVKRRLEVIGKINDITVYDDFAHHPTAIRATLEALRALLPEARIICVLEPRSNTMRLGLHLGEITEALAIANLSYVYAGEALVWDPAELTRGSSNNIHICVSSDEILCGLAAIAIPGDHIVIMSNGGFDNIHSRILKVLA